MATASNLETPPSGETRPPASALALAGLAALLASTCCVLPLVLALAGISGAWISQLRVMEPYSNSLLASAIAALMWAAWRIYGRPQQRAAACERDAACLPMSQTVRTWFWLVLVVTLVPVLVPLMAPWWY